MSNFDEISQNAFDQKLLLETFYVKPYLGVGVDEYLGIIRKEFPSDVSKENSKISAISESNFGPQVWQFCRGTPSKNVSRFAHSLHKKVWLFEDWSANQ